MSGFGGFAPISNNSTVNQPAIQPGGVEPPPNAPAPNEPPQEAPAGNAGGDAAAKELVRSLDVLLARAGKAAGRTVDEAAIAKLAKGAKFDKATVDSLRATAKAANEAMRVLDSFTGEDFANAMDVNQDTGVVDWNRYSYVGKSVKAALDKLADADWKQYDGTEVTATDNNDNLPDHFRKAADMIPEAYKFTGSVDVSFKLHANELQNVG